MSEQDNKQLVRRMYELFNNRDWDGMNEVLSPNVVDRNPAPGQRPGREGIKDAFKDFIAGLPDAQIHVDEVYAEGNQAAMRGHAIGTHAGELNGIPPTGKRVTIPAVDVYEVADGKIAVASHLEDTFGLFVQLGAIQPPTPA